MTNIYKIGIKYKCENKNGGRELGKTISGKSLSVMTKEHSVHSTLTIVSLDTIGGDAIFKAL